MSEWMGLHNVHKHQPISRKVAAETTQGWLCTENAPCRLCLAAEVEALRAREQAVRELHHPVPGFNNGSQWCDAACEATCDGDPTEWPCATIRILDGGDA